MVPVVKALPPAAVAAAFPELAPPAASTVCTLADTLLLPAWPSPNAGPVVFRATPVPRPVFVFVRWSWAPDVPPDSAAPVVNAGAGPVLLFIVIDDAPTPAPLAAPVAATPVALNTPDTRCTLVAVASPLVALAVAEVGPLMARAPGPLAVPPVAAAVALPLLAPLAASTVPTNPVLVFVPARPMARASPVVLVTVPETPAELVSLRLSETADELPVPSAPPVVMVPTHALLMLVVALAPRPSAGPLVALASVALDAETVCELVAVASPLPAVAPGPDWLPLLAPPAASTVRTCAPATSSPLWPTAVAPPDRSTALPELLTLLMALRLRVALESPPFFAPPVVMPIAPLSAMVVLDVSPVPPAAPDSAEALLRTRSVTVWELVAVVSPAVPEPELAPPAASMVPLEALLVILPLAPVAEAGPLPITELPVLLTVVVRVAVVLEPELAPPDAEPVVLLASGALLSTLVLAEPPDPLLAPPAAFAPLEVPLVLVLPFRPVELVLPEVPLDVPLLFTDVLAFVFVPAELVPPVLELPVVTGALLPALTVVVVEAPVELTFPLLPVALDDVLDVALCCCWATVSARALLENAAARIALAAAARLDKTTRLLLIARLLFVEG